MTGERVYAALLRLYPRPFRERYEREAVEAFRELSGTMNKHRARFWLRVLADVARSVTREHIDEWTCGDTSLAIRWIASCAIAFLSCWLVVVLPLATHSRTVAAALRGLPVWVRLTLFGVMLGAAQGWALKETLRVVGLWSLAIGLAALGGFALGSVLDAMLTFYGYDPRLPGAGGYNTVLGLIGAAVTIGLPVGLSHAALLGRSRGYAGHWIHPKDAAHLLGWTIGAMPAVLLGRLVLTRVLTLTPLYHTSMVWPLTVAVEGALLGLLTVGPIARMVGRGRHAVA